MPVSGTSLSMYVSHPPIFLCCYLPQEVQANVAVCVDVFMPRRGLEEVDAGGLGWVVHREGELWSVGMCVWCVCVCA